MTISTAMERGFEGALKTTLEDVATMLSSKYSLDRDEVWAYLSEKMSVTRARASSSTKKTKKSSGEKSRAQSEKPSFFLPWCGSYRSGWCQALKPSGGLYSQCTTEMTSGERVCTTCARKDAPCPSAEERSSPDWTHNNKRPIRYANYLEKKGITQEAAQTEAAKFGVTIPESELVIEVRQRGRPRKTAAVSDSSDSESEGTPKPRRKRGRPAKKSAQQEDLFASIMASQAEADFEVEAPGATEPNAGLDGPAAPVPPPVANEAEIAEAVAVVKSLAVAEAPEAPEAPNPQKMKVAELREALKSRGLETKGKKAELVARLSNALSDDVEPSPVEEPVPEPSSPMTDEMVDMLPNGSPAWMMESVSPEQNSEEASLMESTMPPSLEVMSESDKLLTSLPEMAAVAPPPAVVAPPPAAAVVTTTTEPAAEMVEESYDADTDAEDEPVKAEPFEFDGVKYLKDADNDLYDPETMEHIAWWDGSSVQEVEDDSDDDSDDEQ